MQYVRIRQDHKDATAKSDSDPGRREAGEGFQRHDGTFQSHCLDSSSALCLNLYTNFVFVDLLKARNEALASLKKFFLSVATPKKLRQENENEFLSEQFNISCLDACVLQKTTPKTPQQNGLAERCNRTLMEMAKCLLVDSELPMLEWKAAIFQATRIRNLIVRRGNKKCPAELMRGKKLKLSVTKVSIFGCTVFMRKRDGDVSKVETRPVEGKFVDYTAGDNG